MSASDWRRQGVGITFQTVNTAGAALLRQESQEAIDCNTKLTEPIIIYFTFILYVDGECVTV